MGINAVPQTASKTFGPWVGGVTVATSGMTVNIGGSATLPGLTDGTPDPAAPRATVPLSAAIAITAPASGTAHNIIALGWDGALHLNPATGTPLAALIAWMSVPAGCTDLSAIVVNVLQQTDPSGGA